MCLPGTEVECHFLRQEIADSNLANHVILVIEFSEFNENIWGKLDCLSKDYKDIYIYNRLS